MYDMAMRTFRLDFLSMTERESNMFLHFVRYKREKEREMEERRTLRGCWDFDSGNREEREKKKGSFF